MGKKKDYTKIIPSKKRLPVENYISELPLNVPEETINWHNHILTWVVQSDDVSDPNSNYFVEIDLDTKFLNWEGNHDKESYQYHKRIHNVRQFKEVMEISISDWY